MMDDADFSAIEDALVKAAIGSDEPVLKISSGRKETTDANGDKTVMVQQRQVDAPNIALAERLLFERIGGPQDWC